MDDSRSLRERAEQCLAVAAQLSDRAARMRLREDATRYIAEADRLEGGEQFVPLLGKPDHDSD